MCRTTQRWQLTQIGAVFCLCGVQIKHRCWMKIRPLEFQHPHSDVHSITVFMSDYCQPYKSSNGFGNRKNPWCDGDQISSGCVTVKNSPRVPTPLANPSLYLLMVGNKMRERGTVVLSLIAFDFGETQLLADRNLQAQVSVPPAGSVRVMAAHITEAAGRHLTEKGAVNNTRGLDRQLVLQHMSVMGCLSWNSEDLLFYCVRTKTYFLFCSTQTYSLLSLMFWLVQMVKHS